MSTPPEPILLSIPRVALLLDVSRRLVQSLVYSGELKSVKLRRRRMVGARDLQDFMQGLTDQRHEPVPNVEGQPEA